MTIWTVKPDPEADPALLLLPLRGGVTLAITKDLIRSGKGTHCGECGKPFTIARKMGGVGRVQSLDGMGVLYSTSWILCRRCHGLMQKNGGKISEKLYAEAREAAKAGQLMMTPAGGRA